MAETFGGFIKGILRGVRCTKSLRVFFLHRRPPSWTTLVLYSRAVFIFNEPASWPTLVPAYTTTSVEGVDHCCCTVKKDNDFPVPSRDVTNHTLPGREYWNYSRPSRVWLVTFRLGTGKLLIFFTVWYVQAKFLDRKLKCPFLIMVYWALFQNVLKA
jgi:hypothetical protein